MAAGDEVRAHGSSRKFWSASERNDEVVTDYVGDFDGIGPAYVGQMSVLETKGGIRCSASRERGSLRLRARWADDALGAVFLWGDALTVDAATHASPRLVIAGPGTEVVAKHQGAWRNLRVGIQGETLGALLANAATASAVEPWWRPGIHRPKVAATLEWQLQQQIVMASSFAERAAAVGAHTQCALEAAAEDVVGALVEALQSAVPTGRTRNPVSPSRRLLAQSAIELLASSPDEPVSVAVVCRHLGVHERTLQRAFQETIGVSLRAYERERRLHGVHGAILMEGDHRSITDIAMSFGFWHLGRFAGAYAALFGCSPSETRRRIWGSIDVADLTTG